MEWLFDICCKIMSGLGNILGLSYKEICVIGNIYLQGGIWILLAWIPTIVLMRHKQTSLIKKLYFILALGYGLIHTMLFIMFCERYSFPITDGFDVCVMDLRQIAKSNHTTYQAVNIYIFVIGWLLSVGWNIMITKLIQKNRILWSFIALIIAALSLLIFMFTVVDFLFI
jgi:hypothetical protein